MKFWYGLILGLSLSGFIVIAMDIHYTMIHMDDVAKLVEAKGDADFAKENLDKLLSDGRWILSYDPVYGKKVYKFYVKNKEDYKPKIVAGK